MCDGRELMLRGTTVLCAPLTGYTPCWVVSDPCAIPGAPAQAPESVIRNTCAEGLSPITLSLSGPLVSYWCLRQRLPTSSIELLYITQVGTRQGRCASFQSPIPDPYVIICPVNTHRRQLNYEHTHPGR